MLTVVSLWAHYSVHIDLHPTGLICFGITLVLLYDAESVRGALALLRRPIKLVYFVLQ